MQACTCTCLGHGCTAVVAAPAHSFMSGPGPSRPSVTVLYSTNTLNADPSAASTRVYYSERPIDVCVKNMKQSKIIHDKALNFKAFKAGVRRGGARGERGACQTLRCQRAAMHAIAKRFLRIFNPLSQSDRTMTVATCKTESGLQHRQGRPRPHSHLCKRPPPIVSRVELSSASLLRYTSRTVWVSVPCDGFLRHVSPTVKLIRRMRGGRRQSRIWPSAFDPGHECLSERLTMGRAVSK